MRVRVQCEHPETAHGRRDVHVVPLIPELPRGGVSHPASPQAGHLGAHLARGVATGEVRPRVVVAHQVRVRVRVRVTVRARG